MTRNLKNPSVDKLFEAILQLRSLEECYAFFDDLCTVAELRAMSQRMDVARLLAQGKTYLEIGEASGASTATISRVNRFYQYGSDGYKLVLKRLGQPGDTSHD